MGRSRTNRNRGVTLVEVMVGALVIAVVVIASMNFQAYCALHAHWADTRATAGRVGLLVLEGWKATGGSLTYDPLEAFSSHSAEFTITSANSNAGGTAYPNVLRRFRVKVNSIGTEYHVTLSYSDPAVEPYVLLACVAWRNDFRSSAAPDREVNLQKYAHYIVNPG